MIADKLVTAPLAISTFPYCTPDTDAAVPATILVPAVGGPAMILKTSRAPLAK